MKPVKYIVASALFWAFQLYVSMPTLAFGFEGLPSALIMWSGIMLFFIAIDRGMQAKQKKPLSFLFNWGGWAIIWSSLMAVSLIYMLGGPIVSSWAFFHADAYQKMLGEVRLDGDFSKDVEAVTLSQIRVVDEDMAYRLGDKVMGAQPSLGSQAEMGAFHVQQVNGEFVWVAPLHHSGFFKWYSNPQGTPGYVIVSATNERDVRLVQQVNNKPIFIKYQPGAYGFSDLARHLYFNGYMTRGRTDYTFEIDDAGAPFWVVTLYEKRIGFEGNDATGVVVVDAMTGDLKEYSIADAPKWVDRIQPEEFIEQQLTDWGEYVHGWWNPSNQDKLMPTPGMSLVYDQHGHSYWYTGLTSVGADEGTVGFVLVNTRNKQTTWYRQIGATEQAAMTSARGKVQEKGYVTSFPITYNVNGVPTYVMPLKDQAGLVKMIAMVSVQDYSLVAVGNDVQECARSYKNALNSTGNSISPTSTAKKYTLSSIVERFSTDVQGGRTFYYFTLAGYPQKVFVGTSSVSPELPITQMKDSVLIGYDEGQAAFVDIISFDNLAMRPQKDSLSAQAITPDGTK